MNTVTNNITPRWGTSESPLESIMAGMKAMMEIPPPAKFVACSLFPSDSAWVVKIDRQEHVCASWTFWNMVPKAPHGSTANPFTSVEIVDLDLPHNEKLKLTVLRALAVALVSDL